MASVPTASDDETHCAVPEVSVTDVQPEIAAPFDVKPTVPVGGPAGVTLAVIVTCSPPVEGLGELVTVVRVRSRLTTCGTVLEVLGARVDEPPYMATRLSLPTGNALYVSTAVPRLLSGAEPICTPLLSNVTVPVGSDPSWACTVAVRVTICP